MSKTFFVSVLGVLLVAGAAFAAEAPQQAAPQNQPAAAQAQQQVPDGGMPAYIFAETPERRMQRLGTVEDPGIDPPPGKKYYRFGHAFTIDKFERRLAAYDREPGTVRPRADVNFAYEIYQQNEKYVWVWMPDYNEIMAQAQAEAQAMMSEQKPRSRWAPEHLAFFERIRPQFAELTPREANKTIKFVESSQGLPASGSWRNTLAVADMNEDGFPDIIAPPERGTMSTRVPSIFLGDGKGKWTWWDKVEFPQALDYGAVEAADFNKDGHQDLIFGVHLNGVFLFFGDGKGHFTTTKEPVLANYPTRKLTATDVDKDGYLDIVIISEGPTAAGTEKDTSRLRVLLNRKKGTKWEATDVAGQDVKVGGTWLTVDDLNGDSYPDMVAGSVMYSSWDIVHLSEGPKKWKQVASDGDLIPSMSYYFANTSGKFASKKRRDAIISYVRYWPDDVEPLPPLKATTNIDRITWADGKIKREPIMRWGGVEGIWGMGAGDFDGDGRDDFIFTRRNPREAGLLLSDGKGGFTRAKIEGLPLKDNVNYDAKVADVNGDKRPDVILMYETAGTTALAERNGSIQVFLNQGASTAVASKAAE